MLLIMVLPIAAHAQIDSPCGGDDPFSEPCPIDSWIIPLAFIALLFAVRHLYNNKDPLKPEAKRDLHL